METGLDYRGARFYDSDVARFLSLDPAAMEYPHHSDYCYVAGNPTMFVDLDGKRIIFPEGTSDAFKARMYSYLTIMAVLGEPELRKIAQTVLTSEKVITIKDGTKENEASTGYYKGVITMDNKIHVLIGEKGEDGNHPLVKSTRFTELANELSHAYDDIIYPENDADLTDEQLKYFKGNKIYYWETGDLTASALNEVRSQQVENMARNIIGINKRLEDAWVEFSFTSKQDANTFKKMIAMARAGENPNKIYEIYVNSSDAVKISYKNASTYYFNIYTFSDLKKSHNNNSIPTESEPDNSGGN